MTVFTSEETLVNRLRELDPELAVWTCSWALYFGPVGRWSDLDVFARDRSIVFRSFGWDESDEVENDLKLWARAWLASLEENDPVILLFGSGIRDLLPLALLMYWLSENQGMGSGNVRLVSGFGTGLEGLSVDSLPACLESATQVTADQMKTYHSLWSAFAASEPGALEECYRGFGPGWVRNALFRLLREYPSWGNGLSLTECQILDSIELGISSPRNLYDLCSEVEKLPFLNDWEFWETLHRLASGSTPLVASSADGGFLRPPSVLADHSFHAQELSLTEFGRDVLSGARHYGEGDFPTRWLGGVELSSKSLPCWDYSENRLKEWSKAGS